MTAKTKKVVSLLAFGIFWGSISLGFCGDAVRQEVAMASTRLFMVPEMWSLEGDPPVTLNARVQVRGLLNGLKFELPGPGFNWGYESLPLGSHPYNVIILEGNEWVLIGNGGGFSQDSVIKVAFNTILAPGSRDSRILVPVSLTFTGDFAWNFNSDESYPLVFKFLKGGGAYLCGRGTITTPDGNTYQFGQNDTIETWLSLVNHKNDLQREGAVQALGWLAKTKEEKDRTILVLIGALQDSSWEVRRNAAEALGRLADRRAVESLTQTLEDEHSWVKVVAQESLEKIGRKE